MHAQCVYSMCVCIHTCVQHLPIHLLPKSALLIGYIAYYDLLFLNCYALNNNLVGGCSAGGQYRIISSPKCLLSLTETLCGDPASILDIQLVNGTVPSKENEKQMTDMK